MNEIKDALKSGDAASKRLAVTFILSILGFVLTLAFGLHSCWKNAAIHRAEKAQLQALEALRLKELAEEKEKMKSPPFQSLGAFILELRDGRGSAEFEMIITCETKELCDWASLNVDRLRGDLGPLFVPMDYNHIISPAGKRAFREEIRLRLNQFIHSQGQKPSVIDVFFPNFVISVSGS